MARGPVGSSSAETKLSCIKTELKRCTMTESLWNKYDISRKSPEVPVRRSPKVMRKDRELALNAPWDSTAIG